MSWTPKSFLRQAWHQASDFGNDPFERWIRGQVGDAYNVIKPILFPDMSHSGLYDPRTGRELPLMQGGAQMGPLGGMIQLLRGAQAWKAGDMDTLGYLFHGTDKWQQILKQGFLDPKMARNPGTYGKKVWTTSDPRRAIGHGGKGTDRRVIAIPRRPHIVQKGTPVPSSGDHVTTFSKPVILRNTPETRAIDPEGARLAGEANQKARLAKRLAKSKARKPVPVTQRVGASTPSKISDGLKNYGGH